MKNALFYMFLTTQNALFYKFRDIRMPYFTYFRVFRTPYFTKHFIKLTIKKYEPIFQEYTLGIPNKEVRDGLLNSLIPHYVNPRRSDNNAFLLGFCKAVYRNDIEAALEHMRTYMATIPYDLENHSEKHYQTIFYLMFSFLNIYIRTEVKSAIGRADAVMHMPDTIYVFELKVDKSAEEALAQIDEKGYMLPYHSEGKRLVKIGISFDSTQRTIRDWKIKEE